MSSKLKSATVNMGLVNCIGPILVPYPEGFDNSSMEAMVETMVLFEPINYLFPFLAHALGTLVDAFISSKLASNNQFRLSMLIGVLFLIGGITMVLMVPSPMWFNVVDLVLAYIPMAWIGWKLTGAK